MNKLVVVIPDFEKVLLLIKWVRIETDKELYSLDSTSNLTPLQKELCQNFPSILNEAKRCYESNGYPGMEIGITHNSCVDTEGAISKFKESGAGYIGEVKKLNFARGQYSDHREIDGFVNLYPGFCFLAPASYKPTFPDSYAVFTFEWRFSVISCFSVGVHSSSLQHQSWLEQMKKANEECFDFSCVSLPAHAFREQHLTYLRNVHQDDLVFLGCFSAFGTNGSYLRKESNINDTFCFVLEAE